MPIHHLPVSRREFLGQSAAVLASLAVTTHSWGSDATEASTFALLSDTHIAGNRDLITRDVNMTANLTQVVGEVCALKRKPAGVIVSGDCAYRKGLPADYANFASIIRPITEHGLPLHLMTGNHDNRVTMAEALKVQYPEDPQIQSRFVSVLETPHANLFLLDTLAEVDVVTGELGEAQRSWLAQELDARKEKPAVIVAHHNLQFAPPPEGQRYFGLADTAAFLDLLKDRPQVKAYVFGHTHTWSVSKREGLHLINLPTVAYVVGKGQPTGWVQATFTSGGVNLELRTLDKAHPKSGEKKELTWS